ncbi:hypothetical protein OG736_01150 [Streptomyces sp. NBC_01334]|nr:hypothetical protein OG736_01150 [Streptomyces sp. NBC_01334]
MELDSISGYVVHRNEVRQARAVGEDFGRGSRVSVQVSGNDSLGEEGTVGTSWVSARDAVADDRSGPQRPDGEVGEFRQEMLGGDPTRFVSVARTGVPDWFLSDRSLLPAGNVDGAEVVEHGGANMACKSDRAFRDGHISRG